MPASFKRFAISAGSAGIQEASPFAGSSHACPGARLPVK